MFSIDRTIETILTQPLRTVFFHFFKNIIKSYENFTLFSMTFDITQNNNISLIRLKKRNNVHVEYKPIKHRQTLVQKHNKTTHLIR